MRDWYEQIWEAAPADPEPWAWERRRGWLLGEARPGERVLDLGCGSGRFLRALADAGAVPVGVEIADAALERARRVAPGAELHRVDPDGDLPLADGSIDLVWCSEVIEHVADTVHLLTETRRVLAPGGRLIVTTPYHGRVHAAVVALTRFETHFDPLGQHLRFYTRGSLARALSAHGFDPVGVRATGRLPLLRETLVAPRVRVLIDVSPLNRAPSGTAVYLERLLPALAAEGVDVRTARRRDRPRGGGGPRSYLNAAAETAWTAAELPRRAGGAGADVLHHPLPAFARSAPCPQVVTVHDLAFERFPDLFDPRFRAVARRRHRRAARRAAAVIVPSRATALDVRALWKVDAARIVVAPHGPGQAPPPDRRGIRHFLYVGDAEPRKNLPRLLEAYARYREAAGPEPLGLVLAGSAWATAPGVRCEPDPDLPALHARAAALVAPSLHEGFGLTALEAMHAGTPVLASRITALTEVCGDAARYVDPRDPGSIAAGLTDLATVPPLREALRRRGVARAASFSWEQAARAHVAAYTLALR